MVLWNLLEYFWRREGNSFLKDVRIVTVLFHSSSTEREGGGNINSMKSKTFI